MGGQDIITVALAVAALVYAIHRVRRMMTGQSDRGCGCGRPCACAARSDGGSHGSGIRKNSESSASLNSCEFSYLPEKIAAHRGATSAGRAVQPLMRNGRGGHISVIGHQSD